MGGACALKLGRSSRTSLSPRLNPKLTQRQSRSQTCTRGLRRLEWEPTSDKWTMRSLWRISRICVQTRGEIVRPAGHRAACRCVAPSGQGMAASAPSSRIPTTSAHARRLHKSIIPQRWPRRVIVLPAPFCTRLPISLSPSCLAPGRPAGPGRWAGGAEGRHIVRRRLPVGRGGHAVSLLDGPLHPGCGRCYAVGLHRGWTQWFMDSLSRPRISPRTALY